VIRYRCEDLETFKKLGYNYSIILLYNKFIYKINIKNKSNIIKKLKAKEFRTIIYITQNEL
jgi:hypothetical protein